MSTYRLVYYMPDPLVAERFCIGAIFVEHEGRGRFLVAPRQLGAEVLGGPQFVHHLAEGIRRLKTSDPEDLYLVTPAWQRQRLGHAIVIGEVLPAPPAAFSVNGPRAWVQGILPGAA